MKAKNLLKQLQKLTPKQLNLDILIEADDVGGDRETICFDTASELKITNVVEGRDMEYDEEYIPNKKDLCVVIPCC